ncbi:MAG: hypothetical protein R3E10_06855 [Gemmatimonadota bacterium]
MLIEHPIQVRILAGGVRLWSKGFAGTVALGLGALTPAENLAFQERLNALLANRAWRAAGFAALLALGLVTVWTRGQGSPWLGVPAWWVGAAATAVGAGIGKAIGTAYAHVCLRRSFQELYDRVSPRRPGKASRVPLILVAE